MKHENEQPIVGPWFAIGHVDSANGNGSREVPEFVPTRAELVELVKHYEDTFLSRAYFVFESGQITSTDMRLTSHAERRVAEIIALVGNDAVEAVGEVRNQLADRLGPDKWKRFMEYMGPNHSHEGNDLRLIGYEAKVGPTITPLRYLSARRNGRSARIQGAKRRHRRSAGRTGGPDAA
jgi:hypothetical protein